MNEKDRIFLEHILEEVVKVESSTQSVLKKDFKRNNDLQDATIRRIEIIGEAAKNISAAAKEKHPGIEWRKMAGTRDVLIHAYFSVDLDLIWDVVKRDLPELKKQISGILQAEEKQKKPGH